MERIGRYINCRPLSGGGQGELYLCEHESLPGTLVLKLLRSDLTDNPEALERFHREAQILHELRNCKEIVSVRHLECEEGRYFLPMEYIRGENLRVKIAKAKEISRLTKLRWATEILKALQKAHDSGIIHRDVKPSNIMIKPVRGDEEGHVVLVDFGIAHVEGSDRTRMEQPGTPGYMSPEQIRGKKSELTVRTDIFSAGIVLYELFSGRHPFRTHSDQPRLDVENAICTSEPVPLNDDDVPERVRDIIFRALQKDPDARFQSAKEMADALESLRVEQIPHSEQVKQWIDDLLEKARKLITICGREELHKAREMVETALRLQDGLPEGLSLLADIEKHLKDLEEVDALIEKAGRAIQEDRLTEASTLINRIEDLRSGDSRIHRLKSEYERRSVVILNNATQWLDKAKQYLKMKRLGRAQEQLDRILVHCPAETPVFKEASELRAKVHRTIGDRKIDRKLAEAVEHVKNGNMRAAEDLVHSLLRDKPGDPWIIESAREAGIRLPGLRDAGLSVPDDSGEDLEEINKTCAKIEAEVDALRSPLESGGRIDLDLPSRIRSWKRDLERILILPGDRQRIRSLKRRIRQIEALQCRQSLH